MVWKRLRHPGKREKRRAWPIHAYVGPNGSGKSLAMVWDTLPTLDAGYPVLSTVRLLDWRNPRPCEGCTTCDGVGEGRHLQAHPLWVPFVSWDQLLEFERGDVLMDEVTGVASSRESQAMPAVVANQLVQLRRDDVIVRWSAPAWDRADKIIRQCSQAVTYGTGYLSKQLHDEELSRRWSQNRLFKWQTYDARDFEDFTAGKREELSPISVDWYLGPGSPAFAAYDTYDAVTSIGTVTDSGRCYRCGGRREVPRCRCGNEPAPDAGGGGKPEGRPEPASPTLVLHSIGRHL